MTVLAFRVFPDAGVAALFDEAPGGGDPKDIGAPRNRPAADPASWLPNIYFHTALDNMEVASDTTVTINHASIALATAPSGGAVPSAVVNYSSAIADHLLVTHGLGYEPYVLVIAGSNVLVGGAPIQTGADTRMRAVCAYATTTEVRLYEWARRSATALASLTQDYRVLVLRTPPAPSGNKLLEIDATAGTISMGRGRFDIARRYLQVVPGGSPWGLTTGRSVDLKRGAIRIANPDGTVFDTVPTGFNVKFNPPGNGGGVMHYDGSFAGDFIQVQAP